MDRVEVFQVKFSSKKQETVTFIECSRLNRSSTIVEERIDLPVPATP